METNTITLPIKDVLLLCIMLLDEESRNQDHIIGVTNKVSDKLKEMGYDQAASCIDVWTGREPNYWVPM